MGPGVTGRIKRKGRIVFKERTIIRIKGSCDVPTSHFLIRSVSYNEKMLSTPAASSPNGFTATLESISPFPRKISAHSEHDWFPRLRLGVYPPMILCDLNQVVS